MLNKFCVFKLVKNERDSLMLQIAILKQERGISMIIWCEVS